LLIPILSNGQGINQTQKKEKERTNLFFETVKATSNEQRATSSKQQTASNKQQATSNKQQTVNSKQQKKLHSNIDTVLIHDGVGHV